MKQTPVTQAEWEAIAGFNPSKCKDSEPKAPVERVSWHEAVWFCNLLSAKEGLPVAYRWGKVTGAFRQEDFALGGVESLPDSWGYRLPTEAEWEYACRAGVPFPRYGPLETIAWFSTNSERRTHPVGLLQPNAWGLYDMLGNVWEWCFDIYRTYEKQAAHDPLGNPGHPFRIGRGGGWDHKARYIRATSRYDYAPSVRHNDLGFRLARTQNLLKRVS